MGRRYSQLGLAMKAQPTTIFLWIGNNDALIADETGMPSSMTSVANFTTQYQALITQLTTMTPANLVIANIPDVTKVPYLTPAAWCWLRFRERQGLPTAVLSEILGIVPGDLVNPTGTAEIPADSGGAAEGADHGCRCAFGGGGGDGAGAGDGVQPGDCRAGAGGGRYAGGYQCAVQPAYTSGLTINGYTGTASFLGGFFALDGIHPTNTGYAVMANTFIDTMNAQIKTKIPDVALGPVAAADPFWPPNLPVASPFGAHGLDSGECGEEF